MRSTLKGHVPQLDNEIVTINKQTNERQNNKNQTTLIVSINVPKISTNGIQSVRDGSISSYR
jgi:hypothetical protein